MCARQFLCQQAVNSSLVPATICLLVKEPGWGQLCSSTLIAGMVAMHVHVYVINSITPHHITSHHITSHHITSHHMNCMFMCMSSIRSHHITSHHITSHHITSHHKNSCTCRGPSVLLVTSVSITHSRLMLWGRALPEDWWSPSMV